MLAKTVTEAAGFVAEHGVIKEGAPTLAEFLLASPLRGADLTASVPLLTDDSQIGANLRVCADEENRADWDQRG
jgi:hypothetical protein